jgi:hypothetical protein
MSEAFQSLNDSHQELGQSIQILNAMTIPDDLKDVVGNMMSAVDKVNGSIRQVVDALELEVTVPGNLPKKVKEKEVKEKEVK